MGINGTLSNSDLTVEFSDVSSVFGTSVGDVTAWEFLVGSSYNLVLGYWASGLGSNSADLDGPDGGNNSQHAYFNNGDLGSYTGGFSSGYPTYTVGDIIGVVNTFDDIVFYKIVYKWVPSNKGAHSWKYTPLARENGFRWAENRPLLNVW